MPTPQQCIRDFYGLDFPDDFFHFRDFLEALPPGVLSDGCDMNPAQPFAVANGQPVEVWCKNPRWADRYYYDLPEFVTLFTGTVDGLHWGYFFDAPGEYQPVVVHYWHSDTFEHGFDGDNIFEAVRRHLEHSEADFQEMAEDPDHADEANEMLEPLSVIRETLARFWGDDRPETGNDYLNAYRQHSWRQAVAPTWSRLGVVVPGTKFRALSADPFTGPRVSFPLQPNRRRIDKLTAEALKLVEQGFPGAALKLGHDLWVWTAEFPECYTLLDAAYAALGREPLRTMMAETRAFREFCDSRRCKT